MQAVPCGARSNTRLLPASISPPPPASIRPVRKYSTGILLFVQVKTVLTFGRLVTPQEKNKHTGSTTPKDAFAPASTSGRPRGARAQAGLRLSAPMLHAPTSRSEAETAQGGAPPNPTLIRSTCVLLLLLLYVAATATVVLLLRLI